MPDFKRFVCCWLILLLCLLGETSQADVFQVLLNDSYCGSLTTTYSPNRILKFSITPSEELTSIIRVQFTALSHEQPRYAPSQQATSHPVIPSHHHPLLLYWISQYRRVQIPPSQTLPMEIAVSRVSTTQGAQYNLSASPTVIGPINIGSHSSSGELPDLLELFEGLSSIMLDLSSQTYSIYDQSLTGRQIALQIETSHWSTWNYNDVPHQVYKVFWALHLPMERFSAWSPNFRWMTGETTYKNNRLVRISYTYWSTATPIKITFQKLMTEDKKKEKGQTSNQVPVKERERYHQTTSTLTSQTNSGIIIDKSRDTTLSSPYSSTEFTDTLLHKMIQIQQSARFLSPW